MTLNKMTKSSTTYFKVLFLLAILFIGCKKELRIMGSKERDYLEYSGAKSSVKGVIKQLRLIDSAKSFFSVNVKSDSILWDKSVLAANLLGGKTENNNLSLNVPFIDQNKELKGFLKFGLKLDGTINNLQAISAIKLNEKKTSKKSEDLNLFQQFASSGLRINEDIVSSHQISLSNSKPNGELVEVLANGKAAKSNSLMTTSCQTRFSVYVHIPEWTCDYFTLSVMNNEMSSHVLDNFRDYGAQLSSGVFMIPFFVSESEIADRLSYCITSWNYTSESFQFQYCTNYFQPEKFILSDYMTTCDPPGIDNPGEGGGGTPDDGAYVESIAIELTPSTANICGFYPSTKVGNGYTLGIGNLGFTITIKTTYRSSSGSYVQTTFGTALIGSSCFTVGGSGMNFALASTAVVNAYNEAVETVVRLAAAGGILLDNVSLSAALRLAVSANMAMLPGGSYSSGKCSNMIETTASYGCN